MSEPIDAHFSYRVGEWRTHVPAMPPGCDLPPSDALASSLLAVLDAQMQSRHLDFAARWLQREGEGYYTIGSAGHESNAALAHVMRPTDPALLHYRSGGFYAARAQQVRGSTPISDVLRGLVAAADDPISGGRHKVFGHRDLNIVPQTSTIGSQLPRAVGLAFSLDRAQSLGLETPWPDDAVVVTSFGDASANHSTTLGALNAASYCVHQGTPMPLLLVCEDNGLGISTKTPPGWVEQALSRYPGIDYTRVDGSRTTELLAVAAAVVDQVRASRRASVIHLRTVRLMGHAGSDVELAYRSREEIVRDYDADPLLGTAACLASLGVLTPDEILDRYDDMRERVMSEAERVRQIRRLASAEEVMRPLTTSDPDGVRLAAGRHPPTSTTAPTAGPGQPATLAVAINATLSDLLSTWPHAIVFGEDVSTKGGVYGVTKGLRSQFGGRRVFDTLLDEQTILGVALGAGLAGLLPIPEIQYLAYLHNAEDQLRGEAATLAFFSSSQYTNGMVVRVAGLAYQKGFGGHFHNDNSLAVLLDIPGVVVAVASHPAYAPDLLRSCAALAIAEGRVCIFIEPIALYHTRDLLDGDGRWLAPSRPAELSTAADRVIGRVAVFGDGPDLLMVAFGNGLRMALRAAERLRADAVRCTVLDLRWLAPLPEADLTHYAMHHSRVLVVDETRRSGGVAEAVMAVLLDAGYAGELRRVTSKDSFVPLGPAAAHVLLSEEQIVDAARAMCRRTETKGHDDD